MDYKDKIRKLLKLAESPNENEAKMALLKARELMAEHKLSEEEVAETLKKKVIRMNTHLSCTKRIDPWMIGLSNVIGEAYRCNSLSWRKSNSKTYEIGFSGFEDDIELCTELFRYAVKCVQDRNEEAAKKLRKAYPGLKISEYIRAGRNSYGFGFTAGLKYAFDEQNAANKQEWGLVLKTPIEVKRDIENLKELNFNTKYDDSDEISVTDFTEGEKDGRKFNTRSTLRGAADAV